MQRTLFNIVKEWAEFARTQVSHTGRRCGTPGEDWREMLLAWGSGSDYRRVLLKKQRPAGDGTANLSIE